MRHLLGLTAITILLGLAQSAFAQAAGPLAVSRAEPLLGSPDYKVSADQPVGWRGDWTGKFPGATPPTEWSRRAKGITTEIKCQADRPAGLATGEVGKDAKPLEYFTIKDWLVTGPFGVDDAVKGIEQDFLGDETKVEPAKDAKVAVPAAVTSRPAADVTWRYIRADVETQSRHECNGGTCGNSSVDFVNAFGKITGTQRPQIEGDFFNKVAYAHTYVWSPSDGKVQLQMPFSGSAGKFWLNGKPTDLNPKDPWRFSYDVSLNKGWNRLLVKISAAKALRAKDGDAEWASKWMVSGYLVPAGPVSYETKNVAWMTRMSGRSISQPIIVGDKIFIGSGMTDLMCFDKKSGKILWLHSNTPYDTMTAEERSGVTGMGDKIEPLVAKLNKLNDDFVAAANAAVSPQGMDSAKQADVDKIVKAKADTEKAIHDAFSAADKKKFPGVNLNEVSPANATPVSDGKYVWWGCGGSQWSAGSYIVACFDLDGKRVWTRMDNSLGAAEHGNHSSPALVDGKLIWSAHQTLIAYDAATGNEVWRNKTTETSKDWTNTPGQAVPTKLGGTKVILARKNFYLVSDGTVAGRSLAVSDGSQSLLVDNGVVYDVGYRRGNNSPRSVLAAKLPSEPSGKGDPLWEADAAEALMPVRGGAAQIASPVCVDGIVYTVDMTGALSVLDVPNKKCLYKLWFDGYNRYNRMVYGFCASPTMAGKDKNVYIIDDAGYTHILAPGPQFKEVSRNILENIHMSGQGGNPCRQESFYTSPWFEGSRMYLHGEEYLYCIGDK